MASFAARVPFINSSGSTGAKRSSWNDSRGQPNRDPPASSNDMQFPHIKDIIAQAQPTFDPSVPLSEYLSQCERCLQVSKTSISFGKPDIAFREFLKASEIAINIIPRHKDYGFWEYNDPKWSQRYKTARQVVTSMQVQMEGVRKIIEDNNARHGTQQQSTTPGTNAIAGPLTDSSHSPALSQVSTISSTATDLPDPLQAGKKRPVSAVKPDHLKSMPVVNSDLSERFARLRAIREENKPNLQMPDASQFQSNPPSRASTFSPTTMTPNGTFRPQGPRDMPALSNPPSIPPKLPMSVADMPRPPDATYNVSQSARSSHEGHRPPTEKKQSYYGQPIANASNPQLARYREDMQPYRPRTPNGVHNAIVPKSNSAELPHDRMIDAETLASHRSRYNVLVVDIRSRETFDEGHIMATSIICIEPLALKEGTSADQLEERLVLSPETEQALFARRNEFDLVVYYDQDTADTSYLRGNPATSSAPHLRAFYDTLYEFNEYKPLKDGRPPALLRGGLDAWVNMVGSQSLATSRTAATLGSTRQRAGLQPNRQRTLTRARIASANSRFEIRDRRLRNHQFLDESEQQAWRQQAQQEQVTTDEGVQLSDGEFVEIEGEQEEPPSPYIPDYETFLRRFPAMEQQSMVVPPRRPALPPKRFEPVQMPAIPARPPPAIPRPSYSGQNEITQSQAPLARVASSARQPLYSSSINLRSRKLPRTGLTNFGVTCYMNSTLQCLSSTIPLASFFMDQSTYQSNVQKNWKGSSGIMPEIFANVVRSLWKGDVDMIKPTTFRNFCGRMNREWVIDRQQDAKEFFDFLVDCLHEDLNIAWERTPLRPLTTEQELQRERYKIADAAHIEWQRYEHRDRSFISSLFAGQHASRLKCLTCHNTSTTYEAFYSISIEIPRSGQGDIYRCLESYTQEEKLAPGELWRCPHCKVEREATKQIILTRLPTFLVIHFKRFSASKTESARKIHTPIEFPLYGLNMDRYVLGSTQPQANGHMIDAAHDQNGTSAHDVATTPPFSYDAYAVLRHLGNSGDGGHYVSLVKDPGRNCWRKFDDERHYDFDPAQTNSSRDRLQNSEAYIVFFQRGQPR